MRQIASNARDYDKKVDFTRPDNRGALRTASHRYLPAERSLEVVAVVRESTRAADIFTAEDFKPRWWPGPDVR